MRRGEVWLATLDPAGGAEADKSRSVVVVSNDGANATAERLGRGVVTVVPVTSSVVRVYPFQVLLTAAGVGLERDSKAQAEQVRSIDVNRLTRRIAVLPDDVLRAVDDALRLHLDL